MKKFKKIIILILMFLVIGLYPKQVYADSPTCQSGIDDSNTKKAVGEEFIFNIGTMGASSNGRINKAYYEVEYEKDILEVVEVNGKPAGAYNGWEVSASDEETKLAINRLKINVSTKDPNKMYNSISGFEFVKIAYVKFRVKSTNASSTSIAVSSNSSFNMIIDGYGSPDGSSVPCYNSPITVVNIYKKNNNNKLSSLSIDNIEMNPKFSSDVTLYNFTVNNEIDSININGTCSGTNCKVDGLGVKKLEIGQNQFILTVTAEDGSKNNYTININRKEKDVTYIQSLKIKDIDLFPKFNSDITDYTINIPNNLSKLDIECITNDDENTKVEITGNDKLISGKNYIKIKLNNSLNNLEKEYNIMVIKEEPEQSNIIFFVIIGVLLIGLIVETIIIIKKKKDNKKIEDKQETNNNIIENENIEITDNTVEDDNNNLE